jgi:dTDP-4-dehydrorhamnose 3,5-epimerase
VEYLQEHQLALDYATLRATAHTLGSLFWRDLERHRPGIGKPGVRIGRALALAYGWKGGSVDVCAVPRITGALLFRPAPHVDERGFFCRTLDADVMRSAGVDPAAFVQDSLSRSARGVVRGLHVRRGDGEAKLVRCSYGAIFDVVVDVRPASPTYRNWESFQLRDDEQLTLYVPVGCAHGFQALTDPADVSYKIDRAHDPAEDISIAFDDPELAIPWPLAVTTMSSRDRYAASFTAATRLLR